MRIFIFIILLLSNTSSFSQDIKKIIIGSCLTQESDQPIWNAILNEKSDIFIFAGDNVYGDDRNKEGINKLKKAYLQQKKIIPFKSLKETNEIIAIWDDHDYGKNDGGENFHYKNEAKKLFLQFWEIPKGHQQNLSEGLNYEIKKKSNGLIIQFIILDVRYFKSNFKPTDKRDAPYKERYIKDWSPSKTMLGDKQWTWLSEKLDENADIRFLISSLQVIAEGHGFEKWGNFPLEKKRLYSLVDKNKIKNLIILSGDRHRAGIYKDRTGSGSIIYELTSSSLNLPAGRFYGVKEEPGPKRLGVSFLDENYGLIEIDENNKISLSIKDINQETINKINIPFIESSPTH